MPFADDLNSLISPAPSATTLRGFSDYAATRKNILDKVFSSVQAKFPLTNSRYTVELSGLNYGDLKDYTLAEQQKAIMENQSLYFPLKGKLTMRDNATGAVIDKTNNSLTLARVPYLTNRGTFINSGSEYTLANQARLLNGAYIRKKKSGEYEAHFNTLPGKGRGFRLSFAPETGKFITEIGQSITPVYPMLKALGVEDSALEGAWGAELLAANKVDSAYSAARIYERLTNQPSKDVPEDQLMLGIRNALHATELDRSVTLRTLGTTRVKKSEVPIRGTLKIEDLGYITVPSGLIDGVYYALRDSDKAPGIAPAATKGQLIVITAEEIKQLKKVFKKNFETTCGNGRRFTYNLRNVLPPSNGEYILDVECPELEQLRRSLILPHKPAGGFRLAVGVKVAEDLNELDLMEEKIAAGFQDQTFAPVELQDIDFGQITGNTLLRASQKVLNAQRGLEEVDDRDDLTFQKF